MRTQLLFLFFAFFICNITNGQIKIGDNPQNIDPSSVLELESTERVLVITRVTTPQMNAIVPQQGALVYNTETQCIHYFNNTTWINLCDSLGLSFSTDSVVNDPDGEETIVITQTGDNYNFEVAPSSIRSEQIVDGGINGVDIQNGSIGPGKLQNQSVTQDKISENAVGIFALDNDNIDLGDFNNAAGFITGTDIISPAAGNSITDNAGAFYDDTPLTDAITTNTNAIAADNDGSSSNEIQNLTLAGNILSLSNSPTTINLGAFNNAGTDNQNLQGATLIGNTLTIDIENGDPTSVDLTPLSGTGTDNQNLQGATLVGNTLTIDIENGNDVSVDLSPLSGTGTDNQNLSLVGNVLGIDNGTGVDLTPILGSVNTDNQQLTLSPTNLLALEDGGTPIDLSAFITDTDNQTITDFSFDAPSNILTLTIDDGNTVTANLSALATGNAASVTFTPYLSIAAVNTQSAIEELKDEVDAIVLAGGGNPLDEIQNLNLTTNTLTITNNTTATPIDLSPYLDNTDTQNAAAVPVTATPTNYAAAAQNVEAHLAGIDGVLAGISADNQNIQGSGLTGPTGETLTIGIEGGNSQDIPLGAFALETEVTSAINTSDAADLDKSVTNEIQDLELNTNTLTITNNATATPIDLSPYLDNTDTQNAIAVPVTAIPTNYIATTQDVEAHLAGIDIALAGTSSDDQNIQGSGLTGPTGETLTIGIEGGNSQDIPLGAFALETEVTSAINTSDAADLDKSVTNEIQDLELNTNTLTITNNATATPIDLSPYLDNTDTQNAIAVPVTAIPANYTATTQDVEAHLAGIDIALAGTSTDNQNIQGSNLTGETIRIGIEDGNFQDVSLASFALETEVTAAINASDAADLDKSVTNEIQDLELNTNTLTITNNATATPIDLSPYLDNQVIESTDNSVTVVQTGDDFDLSVPNAALLNPPGAVTGDILIIDGGGNPIWRTPGQALRPGSNTNIIRRISKSKAALTSNDHTIIVEGTVSQLNLPAQNGNTGLILIIKDLGGQPTIFNMSYRNRTNNLVNSTINGGVLWLQSDGVEWQQIN